MSIKMYGLGRTIGASNSSVEKQISTRVPSAMAVYP